MPRACLCTADVQRDSGPQPCSAFSLPHRRSDQPDDGCVSFNSGIKSKSTVRPRIKDSFFIYNRFF